MLVYERMIELENENKQLKQRLLRLNQKGPAEREWNEVKSWMASFGVRLLIVGGAFFFFVVLPLSLIGGV